jgi:hypothetical protein
MKYFIAGGYNKSGTTFLQSLLDSHADIGCSPEHHLKKLTLGLVKLIENYSATVELFDKRTANIGVRLQKKEVLEQALKSTYNTIFNESAKKNNKACGISDNWAYEIRPILDLIYPHLTYIYITRDPREVCTSLYYHIKRTEPGRLDNIDINTYAKSFGAKWNQHIKEIYNQKAKNPKNTIIIKYERLISDQRIQEFQPVLKLLDANDDEHYINDLFERQSRMFQERKNQNKFYRSGAKNSWRQNLVDESASSIINRCRDGMRLSGYD